MEEPHVFDSLPAYALRSLDASEAKMVAQHLAGCHLCRSELQVFQEVAGQIALAAPQAELALDLQARLTERIHSLNQQEHPKRGLTRRLIPIGAMASLLLIGALAISNLVLWQRLDQLDVLAGPLGMRAIALQNTDAAPAASGFVIVSADGENGVVVVDELPELDAQREYQLWLVRNGSTTSGAVFSVDESGYRGMRIEAPQSLLTYSSVLITIEPVGGSVEPYGEHVLAGSLFNP